MATWNALPVALSAERHRRFVLQLLRVDDASLVALGRVVRVAGERAPVGRDVLGARTVTALAGDPQLGDRRVEPSCKGRGRRKTWSDSCSS